MVVTAESVGKVNLDEQATGVPLGWMWQTNGASGETEGKCVGSWQ